MAGSAKDMREAKVEGLKDFDKFTHDSKGSPAAVVAWIGSVFGR